MLGQQIRTSSVTEPRILEVLRTTPRESFVPAGFRELAFADTAIPIGHGQKMLTPQIEGLLLHALAIQSIDEILEIGTGTGFLTACLSRLGASVSSIDIFSEFVTAAKQRFETLRLPHIQVDAADATTCQWSAQYDVVVISAALPQLSERYTNLLKPGGRLFVFIGTAPVMKAQLVTRIKDSVVTENLFETLVEPMINARSHAAFEL